MLPRTGHQRHSRLRQYARPPWMRCGSIATSEGDTLSGPSGQGTRRHTRRSVGPTLGQRLYRACQLQALVRPLRSGAYLTLGISRCARRHDMPERRKMRVSVSLGGRSILRTVTAKVLAFRYRMVVTSWGSPFARVESVEP